MLFSKTNTPNPAPSQPINAQNTAKQIAATSKKAPAPSVITHSMHVLGNIVSDGVIDFDGMIDGNIKCKTLTVRTNALVKGEIQAENVAIYGKVKGTIRAKSVQLFSSCQVEGVVMHETISIEDGAFLDGKCKRTDKVYLNDNQTEDDDDSDEDSAEEEESIKVLENLRLIS